MMPRHGEFEHIGFQPCVMLLVLLLEKSSM